MEPQTGFEPAFSVQLPLSSFVAKGDTEALNLELRVRIELTTSGWKPDTLPLRQRSTNLFIPKTEQSPLLCITVCSMGFHRVDPISVLCKQTVLNGDLEGL